MLRWFFTEPIRLGLIAVPAALVFAVVASSAEWIWDHITGK